MLWLDSEAYRTPIRFVSAAGQSTSHVHVARLDVGLPEPINAHVKLYHPDTGELGAEICGHILARALEIPAPSLFGVIPVTAEQLCTANPPQWLRAMDGTAKAFFCESLPGETLFKCAGDDKDEEGPLWDELLECRAIRRLAALDHWTSNRDRHGGNLLRKGPGHWSAIDYGQCLGYVMWHQRGPVCQPKTHLLMKAAERLRGPALRAFQAEVIAASERHQLAWALSEMPIGGNLARLHEVGCIPPVLSFLAGRVSRDWMARQLGELG